jgi:hypothetical protein
MLNEDATKRTPLRAKCTRAEGAAHQGIEKEYLFCFTKIENKKLLAGSLAQLQFTTPTILSHPQSRATTTDNTTVLVQLVNREPYAKILNGAPRECNSYLQGRQEVDVQM